MDLRYFLTQNLDFFHLNHFDLPTVFTEWAHLAQDRAGWHKLVTTPPFAIGANPTCGNQQPRGATPG